MRMRTTESESGSLEGKNGPFPPDFAMQAKGDVEPLIVAADRALVRLDAAVATLPGPEAFLKMHRRREAVQSCLIDGAQVSLPDLIAAESGRSGSEPDEAREAAVRCFRAISAGTEDAGGEPIGLHALLEMHAILDLSRDAGSGAAGRPGATVAANAETGGLERFVRDLERCLDHGRDMPDIIRVGLAQGRLEALQPFPVANGRLARLLVPVLARRLQVPGAPALGLSAFLRHRRNDYLDRVRGLWTAASWQAWVAFFMEGVTQSATDSAEAVRRFAAMRERHRAAVAANLGHAVARGLRVLDCLFDQPDVTVADVRGITGTTYAAANQLASRLAALGILEESTGQRRNRLFRYGPYLRLFDSLAPTEPAMDAVAPHAARTTIDQAAPANRPAPRPRVDRTAERPRAERRSARPKPSRPRRTMKYISDDLL